MTLTAIKSDKSKSFLLSEQVKKVLHERGFLKVFNYADYQFFKETTKGKFNRAVEIANLFITDCQTTNESDFNDYVF